MFIGAVKAGADTSSEFWKYDFNQDIHNFSAPKNLNIDTIQERFATFQGFRPGLLNGIVDGAVDVEQLNEIVVNAWAELRARVQSTLR